MKDPYIREKYTREVKTARAVVRDYFERFPKDRYETSVESWRQAPAVRMVVSIEQGVIR
jgi:hypothetical protein